MKREFRVECNHIQRYERQKIFVFYKVFTDMLHVNTYKATDTFKWN